MRGFILTPTYRVVRGVPEVHLYGILAGGGPGLIVDDRMRPYFFVRQDDAPRLEVVTPGLVAAATPLRTLDGAPVARV